MSTELVDSLLLCKDNLIEQRNIAISNGDFLLADTLNISKNDINRIIHSVMAEDSITALSNINKPRI